MNKIDIADIPELETPVGMQGSTMQQEVGGPLCLAVVAAILMVATS